jgi:hypothetical protein
MRLGGGLHLSRSPFPACARGCCFPARAMQTNFLEEDVGGLWRVASHSREREKDVFMARAQTLLLPLVAEQKMRLLLTLSSMTAPHTETFLLFDSFINNVYLFTKLNMLIFSW